MGYGPKLNDIFETFERLGSEVKKALVYFHEFAQCDMVSSFYKIGMKKYEFYAMTKDVHLNCLCSLQSYKGYAKTEDAHLHPKFEFHNASSIFCYHSSAQKESLYSGRITC